MRRILAVFVMAAVMVGIAAGPASADAASNCSAGRFCVFTDANGGGLSYYWTQPHGCVPTQGAFNDSISSFSNKTGRAGAFFRDGGCPSTWGATLPFGANETNNNLAGTGFNDAISSYWISG